GHVDETLGNIRRLAGPAESGSPVLFTGPQITRQPATAGRAAAYTIGRRGFRTSARKSRLKPAAQAVPAQAVIRMPLAPPRATAPIPPAVRVYAHHDNEDKSPVVIESYAETFVRFARIFLIAVRNWHKHQEVAVAAPRALVL